MLQGLSKAEFHSLHFQISLTLSLCCLCLALQCEAVLNKSERHMEKLLPCSKHIKAERALNYFSVPWLESKPLGHRHKSRNT